MTQDNSQSMDKLLRGLCLVLHLGAVRNCCQEYADRARREGWTYERFLCELLQAENEQRAENAQKKRLKTAGFPQYKYMEELDMEELPEGGEYRLIWSSEDARLTENGLLAAYSGEGLYALNAEGQVLAGPITWRNLNGGIAVGALLETPERLILEKNA